MGSMTTSAVNLRNPDGHTPWIDGLHQIVLEPTVPRLMGPWAGVPEESYNFISVPPLPHYSGLIGGLGAAGAHEAQIRTDRQFEEIRPQKPRGEEQHLQIFDLAGVGV